MGGGARGPGGAAVWRALRRRLRAANERHNAAGLSALSAALPGATQEQHPGSQVRGHDASCVQAGSAAAAPRSCATPADISMDTAAVERELLVRMTPFEEALRRIYGEGV